MPPPSGIGLLYLTAATLSQHWLFVRFNYDGCGAAHFGGLSCQLESEEVFTSLCTELKARVQQLTNASGVKWRGVCGVGGRGSLTVSDLVRRRCAKAVQEGQ